MKVKHAYDTDKSSGEVVELTDGGFYVLWCDGERLHYSLGSMSDECIEWVK